MVERRVPVHLAVLVGCSTGAYALSLAGITAFQSEADAALVRERGPLARTIDSIDAEHDGLERAVSIAIDAYDQVAATYARLGARIDGVERGLDTLAGLTRSVSSSAASLPSRISLPAVRSAPRNAAPPPTHATTGASG